MGNIIVTQSFISLASKISARTTDTGYSANNLYDHENLMKRHRAADVTANDWLYEINFGGATVVASVFLNRINFNKVRILGHASDISATITANGANNGDCTFDSGSVTISQNKITGRYQAYIPLTSFNYQYMWVAVDNGAAAVTDYTTKWECSTVVCMSAVTTLTRNMSPSYTPQRDEFFNKIEMPHGGQSIVSRGDNARWTGMVTFGQRQLTDRTELLTLARFGQTDPMLFYENGSIETDTSAAYLCRIDQNYVGTISRPNMISQAMMRLVEYV